MSGAEVEHAPHLAVTSEPWPGSVAVYDAPADSDYLLNSVIAARSIIGVTETPLSFADPGRIDMGPPLQVRLASGVLQSVPEDAMLSGANLMAIGDGTPGNWELLQFRDAELLSEDRWLLSHRLRGQAGSDGIVPPIWPEGSYVVLMNGAPTQIALAAAQRNIERHYRIGPARRSYDDPTYVHETHAFAGNGLRPYRPCHLRLHEQSGDVSVNWIRRTRVDGDAWDSLDVPLGEETELYILRILQGESLVREVQIPTCEWVYTSSMQASDGVGSSFAVAVAQVSARYGPGPFAVAEWGA